MSSLAQHRTISPACHQHTDRGATSYVSSWLIHWTDLSPIVRGNPKPTSKSSSQVGLASGLPQTSSILHTKARQPAPLTARPTFAHPPETVRRPPTPRRKCGRAVSCRSPYYKLSIYARDSSSHHLQRGTLHIRAAPRCSAAHRTYCISQHLRGAKVVQAIRQGTARPRLSEPLTRRLRVLSVDGRGE